jgi:hypothetical protein
MHDAHENSIFHRYALYLEMNMSYLTVTLSCFISLAISTGVAHAQLSPEEKQKTEMVAGQIEDVYIFDSKQQHFTDESGKFITDAFAKLIDGKIYKITEHIRTPDSLTFREYYIYNEKLILIYENTYSAVDSIHQNQDFEGMERACGNTYYFKEDALADAEFSGEHCNMNVENARQHIYDRYLFILQKLKS